ncbi:Hypothetical protein AIOL_002296 [Candidatus Rhodobacter oscarellae]|uniref:HemY N-terminal domain-containing protein n=1 Tax=Candidatus Rhodobacter oscarellae TaxID=1675527 RepID=A0A0J9GUS9_9RHOB|nr:heme biosynthesis HemY N-terminal domain-containing protein [Candidatus Rhodobacter lobularis]KMW57333.1 Hypothetical protein AIOL_002296 [Candidatus Rhodobacter lobularis]
MLWSLLKMVLFFCVVAALAVGAGYLLEAGGGVRVALGGMEYNLGPIQALVLLLLLLLTFWLVLKLSGILVALIRFLNGDDTAITRYFDRNREKRGFKALSDTMVALASGDGREAMHQAVRAERLLQKPELTNLLAAQAAEMSGDTKRAETVYRALLEHEPTRFVGVRGIMKQKLAEGDTATALKLAEKAFALKPKHGDTQDVLLQLQASKEDWAGARKTLAAKLSSGTLPRDVHRRRDAVLALSQAKSSDEIGDDAVAHQEAIEANRLSPDLVPAAVMAARRHIVEDKQRYATRVIKKAWATAPHPELAAAFAAIVPDETAQARFKRFSPLLRAHPDDPETKMLEAELQIAAENFPAARRAMGDLANEEPSARALSIMAAIERGEGSDDAVVRGWLTRAISAPRGPQWVCDNCQSIHGTWEPVCGNCGAFDTLTWRAPNEAEVSVPGSSDMLPLLVGEAEVDSPEDAILDPDADPSDGEVISLEAGDADDPIENAKSAN